METRQSWVDITKGIAIIAVVLMHTSYIFPHSFYLPLRALFGYGWHVSVFFIIGGFFIKESRLINPVCFIKNKIKSIYILSLSFYIPAILLHNFLIDIGWYDRNFLYGTKYIDYYSFGKIMLHLLESFLCAGREPILGAMWFVNVLFLSLSFLSIISWISLKCLRKSLISCSFMTILFLFCFISFVCTKYLGLNIPRLNNTFTAAWLIYIGYYLKNKFNLKFDNSNVCVICFLIFLSFCVVNPLGVDLNTNSYPDVITLSVWSVCALYVLCYISIKIQNSFLGTLLMKCGVESFYIMALHFVGFKFAIYICNFFGYGFPIYSLSSPVEDHLLLLPFFTLIGVAFPIFFISVIRFFRHRIQSYS